MLVILYKGNGLIFLDTQKMSGVKKFVLIVLICFYCYRFGCVNQCVNLVLIILFCVNVLLISYMRDLVLINTELTQKLTHENQ